MTNMQFFGHIRVGKFFHQKMAEKLHGDHDFQSLIKSDSFYRNRMKLSGFNLFLFPAYFPNMTDGIWRQHKI